MKKLNYAALLCVLSSTLTAQNLKVLNADSLAAVSLSPGSIISIFGTHLATGVAFADDVQHPPTKLGGVSVTIGGTAAALFYVSPTQINAVVDPATATGSKPLVVTSASGTQNATVTIDT